MTTKSIFGFSNALVHIRAQPVTYVEVGRVAVKEPDQPVGPIRITSPGRVILPKKAILAQSRILRV